MSLLGLVFYLVLLVSTAGLSSSCSPAIRERAYLMALFASVTILASALWFTVVQIAILKSLCRYCLLTHACASIAALIVVVRTSVPSSVLGGSESRPWLRHRWPTLLAASCASLALLILGQTAYQPKTYVVEPAASAHVAPPAPSPAHRANSPRLFPVHDGRFQLNIAELPTIGSPDASNIVVSLFDYTCHHCRQMHPVLVEAQQHYSNRLAIVNLPSPLDTTCNPLVPKTPEPHRNACEYARLGLALWRTNRQAFAEFDTWLFSKTVTPSLLETREHAETLVGQSVLANVLRDPWIDQQIAQDVAIFQTNYRITHRGEMPQLIVGNKIVVGLVQKPEDLYGFLHEHLGL